MPHLNHDPVVCTAAVIQSLQTIVSRNIDPLDSVVLSIGVIEGGKAPNVVAEDVTLKATIRSLSDKALDRAIERVNCICQNTAEAYECKAEVSWEDRIPVLFNTDEMYEKAYKAAIATGYEVTDSEPSLASEDFAVYRAHVPTFFYWIGSTPEGEEPEDIPMPKFHGYDSMIKTAAELLARAAMTE